jgi:hypothetical protein
MLNRLLELLVISFALITSVLTVPASNSIRAQQPLGGSNSRSLPFYNVIDWLIGEVRADGKLVLHGQVVRPILRSNVERGVREIEGIT